MKSYRLICRSHAKVWTLYIRYEIRDVSEIESDEQEYELTVKINDRILKQMKNEDDKILRAYIWWYIDWMILFKNNTYDPY